MSAAKFDKVLGEQFRFALIVQCRAQHAVVHNAPKETDKVD
jgi:hypothetical protein